MTEQTTTPETKPATAQPDAVSIGAQIGGLIAGAGAHIPADVKAGAHIAETVIDLLLPLAASKVDVAKLQDGISQVVAGAQMSEKGVFTIIDAVKNPAPAPVQNDVVLGQGV